MKAMTGKTANDDAPGSHLDEKKDEFRDAASEYFATLSYIDVNLRRQIYALEEANIIPANNTDARLRNQGSTSMTPSFGSLDVSWLNSRNDKVDKDMEAEIWSRARDVVDKLDELRPSLPKESGT